MANLTDMERLDRLEATVNQLGWVNAAGNSDNIALYPFTEAMDSTFEPAAGGLPWAINDHWTINYAITLANSAYVDPDDTSVGMISGTIGLKLITLTTWDLDMAGSGFSLISEDMSGTPSYTSAALSNTLSVSATSSLQTLTFAGHCSLTVFKGATPDIQVSLINIGTWLATGTISVTGTEDMQT